MNNTLKSITCAAHFIILFETHTYVSDLSDTLFNNHLHIGCFAAPMPLLLQFYALSRFIVDMWAKDLHGVGYSATKIVFA